LKKISWKKAKGGRAFEHLLEGYIDGEIAFIIEGRSCVTDLRAMKASHKTDTYVSPNHYRLSKEDPKKEAKEIASDLLNGLNLEKHQANWQKLEDESSKTSIIIAEAKLF